ncbi:MAG: HlyC/CorC family transporter [Lachnospiraceae bacterium]|nr:HlyC/CorC family transporter [Lachnospiraceae bacterium]
MNGDTISLIIVVFCIVMSGYFSATETAFSCLNRIKIKNLAEKGNKKAKLVLGMSENYDTVLSTILIGNNIVNILCASLSTMLFVSWLGDEAGPSVSTAVITVIVLIFGEVTPKSIAKESPEKFAMFAAPLLKMFAIVLTPFNYLFGLWKKLVSKIVKPSGDRSITEEELLTIVEEAEHDGGIGEQEGTLIRSAIEFAEQEAIDILTPRVDISGVEKNASMEEIANMFADTGYSRLPVYEESLDKIIGIIYHKDFYNKVYGKSVTIEEVIRPTHFTTKTKKISELLKELQKEKSHIAVVVDEFGGTIGIVTLEDILEELVGEIWDEHDEVIQEVLKINDEKYEVLGSTNVEKLFEVLDIDEEADVVTVSGWVMDNLGKLPAKGDVFDFANLTVTVLEMNGRRVSKVEIIVKEKQDTDEQ